MRKNLEQLGNKPPNHRGVGRMGGGACGHVPAQKRASVARFVVGDKCQGKCAPSGGDHFEKCMHELCGGGSYGNAYEPRAGAKPQPGPTRQMQHNQNLNIY
jgi:hypothetical protein